MSEVSLLLSLWSIDESPVYDLSLFSFFRYFCNFFRKFFFYFALRPSKSLGDFDSEEDAEVVVTDNKRDSKKKPSNMSADSDIV